jgi:ethanolamine ammonia-lyase small subunit
VNTNELKSIIEEVLAGMNAGDAPAAEAPAAEAPAADAPLEEVAEADGAKWTAKPCPYGIEDGELEQLTDIDVRTLYLVENPYDKESYAELKYNAPCRLAIGKAGARYKTMPQLMFRADHAAAQDACFSEVDQDYVDNELKLFTVQTQCDSKDTYLTRPDLGRKLSDEAVATIKEKCEMNPQVQVYVSDGLSSSAIRANAKDCLDAIMQGLKSKGVKVGTPFFVKYGRVGVMDQVSEITGAEATCVLIGERPGLITANSMSAYMGYKCEVGMNESRRTLLSNIHAAGTNPAEGGAHVADVLKIMLDKKVSGVDLKL